MRVHFIRPIVAVAVIVCLVVLAAPSAWAQNPGPKIIPSDSVVYGKTYSEWSAAWQQWALSVPVASHPLFDNGDCSVGQSGSVWFLGGKFCANNATNCGYNNVQRVCSVPAGKALYVAVFNSEDSTLEDPARTQIFELRQYVSDILDQTTNLTLDVDGAAVPRLKERFRVQSPAFSFTLPVDNQFAAIYGTPFAAGEYFPGLDDGVYVMLSPLPPGQHVLHFHGYLPAFNFTLDVSYLLNVAK